jgi:hypothetical protein
MVPTWLREKFAHPNGSTGGTMKRAIVVALATGAVISSAAALGIGGADASGIPTLTRTEYRAALARVEHVRGAMLLACEAYAGQDRELCRAEAAAAEMVQAAEIEARFRRTPQAERAAQRARIDARYQVERTRCGALNGFRRDRCLVQAHATKGRALLEAAAPYEVRFKE